MKFMLALCLFLSPAVVIAMDTGRPVQTITNDNTGTTITAAAYVQLTASTGQCDSLMVYNSSTKSIFLGIGLSGVEIKVPVDFPGSSTLFTKVNIQVKSGSRLSAKAIGADATTGILTVVCLQ